MEKVKCADCGKEEEYNMKPGYPRKYCSACSAKRKAEFEGKPASVPLPSTPQPSPQETFMSAKDELIIAQVILKCAVELGKALVTEDSTQEHIGKMLAVGVNELTGAYKLALSNIKAL